jgi:hypothetical protein
MSKACACSGIIFDKGFASSEFVMILNRRADDVSLVAPLTALN